MHYDLIFSSIVIFMLQGRFGASPRSYHKPRSSGCSSLSGLLLSPRYSVLCSGLETKYFFSPIPCAAVVHPGTQLFNIKDMNNSISTCIFPWLSLCLAKTLTHPVVYIVATVAQVAHFH